MPKSIIDLAREGAAPLVASCVVAGEGETVRIAFIGGEDGEGSARLLSAVTLTRSQLTGFAGMVAAVLDATDPNALSVN